MEKKHRVCVSTVKNTPAYCNDAYEDGTASVESYCELDYIYDAFDSGVYAIIVRSKKAIDLYVSISVIGTFGTGKSVTLGISRRGSIFDVARYPLDETDRELATVTSNTLAFGEDVVNLDGEDAYDAAEKARKYSNALIETVLKIIFILQTEEPTC